MAKKCIKNALLKIHTQKHSQNMVLMLHYFLSNAALLSGQDGILGTLDEEPGLFS
jgi:hypothetical protein